MPKIIYKVLEYLQQAAELIPGPFEGKSGYLRRIKASTFYGSIYRLQKRGLVDKKQHQGRLKIYLTRKGVEYKIPKVPIKVKRVDGLFSMVIFDIPESKRRKRTVFRKILKDFGYQNLQKSVFVGQYKIDDELIKRINDLKLTRNIKIIEGKLFKIQE